MEAWRDFTGPQGCWARLQGGEQITGWTEGRRRWWLVLRAQFCDSETGPFAQRHGRRAGRGSEAREEGWG